MRIAAILCTLLMGIAMVVRADTYPEKIKRTRSAIVEVLISGERRGTGFCVSSDGYIITATHVVGTPEVEANQVVVNYQQNLSVRFADGRVISVQPVLNPTPEAAFHDITILKADVKTSQFLHVGTPGSLLDGDEVYIMGFPFDVPVTVSYRGNVSARFPITVGTLKGTPVQSSTIHVQIPVAKGFSGSPLLRMSDDTVLGVITNKLGGINQRLDDVRQSILEGQKVGRASILGVDPNATSLELINVLDNFLSAGAGWAVSIDHVKPFLEKRNK
jgi:S1-C subfamily serine protease